MKTKTAMVFALGLITMFTLGSVLIAAADTPLTAEQIRERLAKYQGSSLTVTSWGGSYQEAQRKAYFEPFEKEFGIKIVEDSPADNSKLIAMVKANNVTWDVVDVGSYKPDDLGRQGYLEELDYSIIDTRDCLQSYVSKWHIGTISFSETLGIRTDAFPPGKAPTKATDMFDVQNFPGRRSMRDNPIYNIPLALAADGLPYNQVYPLTEEKIQRAFKKLDEIKPHINVWWTQGAQPAQLLTDNEVVMATGWNGRISTVAKEGVPVKVIWDGGQLVGDSWVIPKGSKNKELAMLFIAWATLPENNWRLSTMIDYGPINKKSIDKLPKDVVERMPPAYADIQILCDFSWWAENYSPMVERWREWKLK